MKSLEYSINDDINIENNKDKNNLKSYLCIKIFLAIFTIILIVLIILFILFAMKGNNDLKDSINKSNNNKKEISNEIKEIKIYINKTQENESKTLIRIENKLDDLSIQCEKEEQIIGKLEKRMNKNDQDKILTVSKINELENNKNKINNEIKDIIDEENKFKRKIEQNDNEILIINNKILSCSLIS